MKRHFYKIMLLSAAIALAPASALAAEIRLDTNKTETHAGEEFVVSIRIDTTELVNAVEGQIVFPEGMISVSEIRDGGSSIDFWIERPRETQSGRISFSGITPGGLSGTNNEIFSVVFRTREEGSARLSISQARALQHDGFGTEQALTLKNAIIEIRAGDGRTEREVMQDVDLPESFPLAVERDDTLFGNAWFVAFATQDKGSGLSRYEIKEYRLSWLRFFLPWRAAESPMELADQSRKSYVTVRAVDNAGNAQVASVPPAYPVAWYERAVYGFIAIVVLYGVIFLFSKLWRRNS